MDGLLVDSEPLWFEIERQFAAARGGGWTQAHAAACVGKGMAATLATMHELFGFAVDLERDRTEIVDRFVARAREIAPKPGALELLREAAPRLPLALASSSPRRLVDAVLSALDLGRWFEAVVSGETVAHPKPAPDIFVVAAGQLGVPIARCAVLEDSLAGATAGRAAGAFVVAVPEGDASGRGFEAVADAVVADLVEARRLLDF